MWWKIGLHINWWDQSAERFYSGKYILFLKEWCFKASRIKNYISIKHKIIFCMLYSCSAGCAATAVFSSPSALVLNLDVSTIIGVRSPTAKFFWCFFFSQLALFSTALFRASLAVFPVTTSTCSFSNWGMEIYKLRKNFYIWLTITLFRVLRILKINTHIVRNPNVSNVLFLQEEKLKVVLPPVFPHHYHIGHG